MAKQTHQNPGPTLPIPPSGAGRTVRATPPSLATAAAQAAGGRCGPVRPSRRGRWRAVSLVLIHLAVGAHLLHWYLQGRTLTPMEPSEAIQTLSEGLVNAGFVLFAILILGTLVFGRFFCGWSCHIVALQDACTWLLRRAGIRPRPFRSRLLVAVPLLAAGYMFVWPSIVRLMAGRPRAEWQARFTTENFWDRFPGWPIAILTFLVCGFLIVYVLGNKGFCTYGCPYGGVFGMLDRVAPGKIRVTDACEGCAHCTATCTSNVRVHEEVRLYGMVVDSGCMKCMDCVNVCPKDALYFGFGAPSIAMGRPRAPKPARRFDFTWPEEIAMAIVFLASLFTFVMLYDRIPLLLGLGLAAITASGLLTAWRALRAPDLRFAQFQLRLAGRTTRAGAAYLCVSALWLGFVVHSASVRWLTFEGTRRYEAALASIHAAGGRVTPETRDGLEGARTLLDRSERLGLVPVAGIDARLGSACEYLGDSRGAEEHYRRAVELNPASIGPHFDLARTAAGLGDRETAIAQFYEVVRRDPEYSDAHLALATLLVQAGRGDEAIRMLEGLVTRRPDSAPLRLTYGAVLSRLGQDERGLEETRRVVDKHPEMPLAQYDLARILDTMKRPDEALAACERSVTLDASFTAAHLLCAQIAQTLSQSDVALRHLETARHLAPFSPPILQAWAGALSRAGSLNQALAAAQSAPPSDRAARFSLIFLYEASGRPDQALPLRAEFPGINMPPPSRP